MSKCYYVSNRLPFSLQQSPAGEIQYVKSSGGLVTALLGVKNQNPTCWVGITTDPLIVNTPKEYFKENFPFEDVISILISKELYNSYYNDFCNDVIWPLFHYEGQRVKFSQKSWNDYIEVNKLVAAEIAKTANDGDVVWIHDFHFCLLAQYLRSYNKNIKIGFFLHIPFPSSEIFRQLPVRKEILEGLLHCDLIGFHDYSYLRHFTVSLWNILSIESNLLSVNYKKRKIKLGVFPVSIDTPRLQSLSQEPRVVARVDELKQTYPDKLILGIDRLDYSKGLELKLLGFKNLLENRPEWIGKVTLLQIAIPTRIGVKEYLELKQDIEQLIGEINGKFGTTEYVPVRYVYNSVTEDELISLYRTSDVMFITSKRDGMNLVALEYVASQNPQNPGSVVLSEFTGASSILSEAIRINPWDATAAADGLVQALLLPLATRISKHERAISFLEGYTSQDWATSFLNNLLAVSGIKMKTHHLFSDEGAVERLQETLREKKNIALFIDFDGTLAALEDDPSKVVLSETIKKQLERISAKENCKVIIISGRNKNYLSEQFNGMNVDLVSEHGASYFDRGTGKWQSLISSNVNSWIEPAKTIMNDYTKRVPLSFLEKKEASLVWHYRQSPSQFANYQAKKLADELDIGLSNLPATITMGKKNVEVRAYEANKGEFVASYTNNLSEKDFFPIAIGDDVTDEDMFRVLRRRGLAIKVGLEDTAAEYRISDQLEIWELLNLLIENLP